MRSSFVAELQHNQIRSIYCNMSNENIITSLYIGNTEQGPPCVFARILRRTKGSELEALRKNLCKNNQLQKNDFVVRAADRSLFFLFQYKLNTAVCQAPDAKYPDATKRSAVKSGYFAAASVQPVRIHYLKLTEHFAPVPKRHCPFLGYLRCCQIQSL